MQNKNVEMKSQKSKTVKSKKPKTLAYTDTWRGLHNCSPVGYSDIGHSGS